MFDVAKGFARRVPITKLAELDPDVRPYLASLLISALQRAGETLTYPREMKTEPVGLDQFNNMIAQHSGKVYDQYGVIGSKLVGTQNPTPEQVQQAQNERITKQMDLMNETLLELVDRIS